MKAGQSAARAICTGPIGKTSRGPRGPSGVRIMIPPERTKVRASRKARMPPFDAPSRPVEPRTGGILSRAAAREMNAASGESEIITLRGFSASSGRQAMPWAMRPCQNRATAPSDPAMKASTGARFSNRTRRTVRMIQLDVAGHQPGRARAWTGGGSEELLHAAVVPGAIPRDPGLPARRSAHRSSVIHQRCVSAGLNDLALIEHIDPVGPAHGPATADGR